NPFENPSIDLKVFDISLKRNIELDDGTMNNATLRLHVLQGRKAGRDGLEPYLEAVLFQRRGKMPAHAERIGKMDHGLEKDVFQDGFTGPDFVLRLLQGNGRQIRVCVGMRADGVSRRGNAFQLLDSQRRLRLRGNTRKKPAELGFVRA